MILKRIALASAVLLGAAFPAHASIIFDNQSRQDFTSNRGAGSSPLAIITVASATTINQIGAFVDLATDGNLKFVIFDAGTSTLLFDSGSVAFGDDGLQFKLSPIFANFNLNPGVTYGIGAVADVAGLWGTNNNSSGNPFTQGVISASDDRNLNVSNYNSLTLGGEGSAMIIVQLGGGGAVPEPASWALLILGFGAVGGAMRSTRRARIRFA